MRIERTERFTLTLGIVPGYAAPPDEALPQRRHLVDAVACWQDFMRAEGDRSGVYVAAVVQTAVAVYGNEAGPRSEAIMVFSGTRNPKYAPDEAAWELAVLRVCGELKHHYGQTTAQVDFSDARMVYYEEGD